MTLKECMKEEKMISYLKKLQNHITVSFESLEKSKRFERKLWNHVSGGGGEIRLLRGDVFEKAAVNWSGVRGKKTPIYENEGPFFATGISLITHMQNPKMPTVHMNLRFIKTKKRFWFGGGYDLTPMGFFREEDKNHFHAIAKSTLDPFGQNLYPLFMKNAKNYFFIPHWNKERGIGGIFFDNYNSGNFEKDFAMWKSIGTSFLKSIMPIYHKHLHAPYTKKDKTLQNQMRAHYVEFNLLYDRGTQFGFASKGNPEAILCSMPPTACW